jgi:hypothetical protein
MNICPRSPKEMFLFVSGTKMLMEVFDSDAVKDILGMRRNGNFDVFLSYGPQNYEIDDEYREKVVTLLLKYPSFLDVAIAINGEWKDYDYYHRRIHLCNYYEGYDDEYDTPTISSLLALVQNPKSIVTWPRAIAIQKELRCQYIRKIYYDRKTCLIKIGEKHDTLPIDLIRILSFLGKEVIGPNCTYAQKDPKPDEHFFSFRGTYWYHVEGSYCDCPCGTRCEYDG